MESEIEEMNVGSKTEVDSQTQKTLVVIKGGTRAGGEIYGIKEPKLPCIK